MRALAIAAVMLASVSAGADDKRYSLVDLERLVHDGAYREAVGHLGDVAPAQRTPAWVEVAAAASAGLLATLPTDDGSTLVTIDAIDREYPQILKSAKYTKVRADLGARGLAGCYRVTRTTEQCAQLGTRLAQHGDRALVIEVAKLTVAHGSAADAVALFKRAIDPALCREEPLGRAVVAGLSRPADSMMASDARSLMTTCWDAVQPAVVKLFDEASPGGHVHRNTCDQLVAKRLLSSLQAKRCTRR